MRNVSAISIRITLLILALVAVLYAMFYLKHQGLGENFQKAIGVESPQQQ